MEILKFEERHVELIKGSEMIVLEVFKHAVFSRFPLGNMRLHTIVMSQRAAIP